MNNEAKRMLSDAQQNATGAPIANTQSSSQSVPLQSQAPRPAQQQQQQQVRSNQPQYSQADLNRIVLDYLNKKGYHRTESMLRLESTNTPTPAGAPATPATTELVSPSELVVNMEDKLNKDAKELRELKEKQSKVERELQETKDREVRLAKEADLRQLKALEAKTRTENDPDTYFMAYSMLRKWVESSLDLYKPELSSIVSFVLYIVSWT